MFFSLFQDSQRSELLETFHKLAIPEPGTSVHLGVVSGRDVNWGLSFAFHIITEGCQKQFSYLELWMLFSCEDTELWNSRFHVWGPVSLSLTLNGSEMLLFDGRKIGCSSWKCLTASPVTCGRSQSSNVTSTVQASAELLDLASMQRAQDWKASSGVPALAALWLVTVYHLFWWLFLSSPQEKDSDKQNVFHFHVLWES